MFNLFGKKTGGKKIADIVWASEDYKLNGLVEQWKKSPGFIICCWFEETAEKIAIIFQNNLIENPPIYTTRQLHNAIIKDQAIVFAEHYPLRKKEEELFEQLAVEKITIYSALNEPLFLHFGGEKTLQLMKQLGMKEEEPIKNDLITKAIIWAQEKIEGKVDFEISCHSQSEWLKKNLPPQS